MVVKRYDLNINTYWLVGYLTPYKQPRSIHGDEVMMMIDRSPGSGIIPYSFRIILSVLLGAQIHRQINIPTPGPFDNPFGALGGEPV